MHELAKLAEARYFYSRMLSEIDNREAFNYNLSAFLSSARSVLQYALEEVETKKGGQQWYQNQVAGNNILSFFKDRRDINIHAEPVKPIQHTSVIMTAHLGMSASVSIVHRDAKGNVLYQSPVEIPKPQPKAHETPAIVTTRYVFSDWKGNEDVMSLSQMYLTELQHVVEDGMHKGLITG